MPLHNGTPQNRICYIQPRATTGCPSTGYANDDEKSRKLQTRQTTGNHIATLKLSTTLTRAPITVVVDVNVDRVLEIAAELFRLLLR